MPYAAPGLHAVAYIYPPLYFYLSAAVAALAGAASFWPLRAVSLAASVAVFALIYALARQAGAGRAASLVAVGLFAACFRYGVDWLSLARVDALFLALFLAGLYALSRARGLGGHGAAHGYLLAGALLALSALTKQTALGMALPLAAWAIYADRRRGWLLAASMAAVLAAAWAGFAWASQGWFGYYVLNGAGSQPLQFDNWLMFVRQNLLPPLWPVLLAGLAFVLVEWRAGRPVGLWVTLLVGTAGSGLWVLLHLGAAQNNLLPVFAVAALLGGLAADRALTWADGRPGLARAAGPVLIYALCIWQMGRLAYNPLRSLPTAADRQAGAALVARVAQVPGDVFLPEHGLVAALAGKPGFAHVTAIDDVLATGGPPAAALLEALRSALRERRFGAVLVDDPDFARRYPELPQNYRVAETLPSGGFFNVRGPRARPVVVYVPK
jgi:4-amino-4-deoxy-L-arabinose transferase-like glycosyltransferase